MRLKSYVDWWAQNEKVELSCIAEGGGGGCYLRIMKELEREAIFPIFKKIIRLLIYFWYVCQCVYFQTNRKMN